MAKMNSVIAAIFITRMALRLNFEDFDSSILFLSCSIWANLRCNFWKIKIIPLQLTYRKFRERKALLLPISVFVALFRCWISSASTLAQYIMLHLWWIIISE